MANIRNLTQAQINEMVRVEGHSFCQHCGESYFDLNKNFFDNHRFCSNDCYINFLKKEFSEKYKGATIRQLIEAEKNLNKVCKETAEDIDIINVEAHGEVEEFNEDGSLTDFGFMVSSYKYDIDDLNYVEYLINKIQKVIDNG